jgi:hypothetical protein
VLAACNAVLSSFHVVYATPKIKKQVFYDFPKAVKYNACNYLFCFGFSAHLAVAAFRAASFR